MAASINADLLISGILRRAKQEENPEQWLTARHGEALDAVMAGDEYVTSTNFEGSSHTAERGLTAATLLAIYESALNLYAQEQAAESGGLATPGSVRHADFSKHPCTLG